MFALSSRCALCSSSRLTPTGVAQALAKRAIAASPSVQLAIDLVSDTHGPRFPATSDCARSVVERSYGGIVHRERKEAAISCRTRCSLDAFVRDGIAAIFLLLDLRGRRRHCDRHLVDRAGEFVVSFFVVL